MMKTVLVFAHTEPDVRLRDTLMSLDTEVLGESTRLFSNACNTAARLARYNGLTAEPLYHPPPSPASCAIPRPGRSVRRSRGSPPIRGRRKRSATPATSARARSRGTGLWIDSWRTANG